MMATYWCADCSCAWLTLQVGVIVCKQDQHKKVS